MQMFGLVSFVTLVVCSVALKTDSPDVQTINAKPKKTFDELEGLLKDFEAELLQELDHELETGERLSDKQSSLLRSKLKKLYSRLMYREQLAMTPSRETVKHKSHSQKRHWRMRERRSQFNSHAVCPSHTEWKRLNKAFDINNTLVEVYQPPPSMNTSGDQYFYITSCTNHTITSSPRSKPTPDCPNCCLGIDHRKYMSSCEQKKSLVKAWYWKPDGSRQKVYDYILINTSCNCAVSKTYR